MKHEFTILQIHGNLIPGQGDYVYRIRQPGEAMGRIPGIKVVDCYAYSPLLRELCLCADLVILHLLWEPDIIPLVLERKRLGLATVYEISDNFLAVPPSCAHVTSSIKRPIAVSTIFQLIQLSDAIQGVSTILMDRFSFLHAHPVVFENHLMQVPELSWAPKENITIGWAGSTGHTEDLKWIAPLLKDICLTHPQVRFSFMGGRQQYDEVFGGLANDQFSYTPGGVLSEYFTFLESLDIGLAPLKETPFNAGRSDVKFIEYASRGVVPVLSDFGPYQLHAKHEVNAFLFDGPDSLKKILETLIGDKGLRERVRQSAYAYVKNERVEADHARERISFYRQIAAQRPPNPLPVELLDKMNPETEYFQTKMTPSEQFLIQGVDHRDQGKMKEAKELLWKSASESHNYYFPLLIAAETFAPDELDQAIQAIRLSLAMNPESLSGRLKLGQALKRKDIEAAKRQFELALSSFPGFAPALYELAVIEAQEGKIDKATQLLDRALQVNPFYAPAASGLGKISMNMGDVDRAVSAFQVAADLDPDNRDYLTDLLTACKKRRSQ
ncbi:MAG: tetratricopeptide repeat protein [Desulfatiglandales bacterium]